MDDKPTPEPCERCGEVHRPADCQAHRKSDGKQCTMKPVTGATVCRSHGVNGRTKRKIERTQQRRGLEEAVATYGLPRDVDPTTALTEEIHRSAGHVQWLAAQIAALDPEAMVWARHAEEMRAGRFQGRDEQSVMRSTVAGMHVLVEQYLKERQHLVKVCATAVQLGLHEREVKLVEEHGSMIANMLRAFIADPELGLTPVQIEAAKRVAPRHLRAVG